MIATDERDLTASSNSSTFSTGTRASPTISLRRLAALGPNTTESANADILLGFVM